MSLPPELWRSCRVVACETRLQLLLNALRTCYEQSVSFKTIIRLATGFTHQRRIEIVRALTGKSLSFQELWGVTGMSIAELSRHLDKLECRGFVKESGDVYRITGSGNALGRTLLKLARG